MTSLLDAFWELDVQAGNAAKMIGHAFDLMRVAEEETAKAMRENPEHRKVLWNCFGALRPGQLSRFGEDLYRSHCREILDRAMGEEDLRPGTSAEVLAAISTASLASRLQRDVENLALSLAASLFPGRASELSPGEEEYPGSRTELMSEFRRKTAVGDRAMSTPLREVPEHAAK